jgi:undecaprenyl pyrophosphate phosphatase UppP
LPRCCQTDQETAQGLAQVVAGVFPGPSRSAAAIFIAMLAGLSRRENATEFVVLLGIPTMFAASAYALLELWLDGGHNPHAARAIARHLKSLGGKTALVTAMLASKDSVGFFMPFRYLKPPVFTMPNAPGHLGAEDQQRHSLTGHYSGRLFTNRS